MQNNIKLAETGAPTYAGRILKTAELVDFAHESDSQFEPYDDQGDYECNLARCIRAKRDGFVLCLRPTADRPVVIGMGAHQAADALRSEGYTRFVIMDRYDDASEEIAPDPETAQHAPDCECDKCHTF